MYYWYVRKLIRSIFQFLSRYYKWGNLGYVYSSSRDELFLWKLDYRSKMVKPRGGEKPWKQKHYLSFKSALWVPEAKLGVKKCSLNNVKMFIQLKVASTEL